MKSYLSLIPISAKAHRQQNRMTILCIVFAVFLVTAVFSMADLGVSMEKARLLHKHGDLALQGLSGNAAVQTFYTIAAALFALILVAGVLMIAGSINSNVAQRTKFFGMMRCIGMSKRQIIRFVRLEALHWCKTAVPIGIILGITVTWGLSFALRFLVGGEFSAIPLFEISPIGMASGAVVGVVTVFIAAGLPAKRAAKVSPLAAVSGNSENADKIAHAANTRFCSIEIALGIHHAVSEKKNWMLMASSFALSIVLFLCFSVLIEFIGCLLPQSSSAPDISIASADGSNSIDRRLLETIGGMDGVERVFGRRSCFRLPATFDRDDLPTGTIDVISYDAFDLDCLAKDKQLRKGGDSSKVYGDSKYALATWDKDRPLNAGDKIQIGSEELEIAGLLNFDPFSGDGNSNGTITLIVSGETFARLTGIADYSLVMVQTTKDATDGDVEAIRNAAGEKYSFADQRDQRAAGTYMAFMLFVYGFLAMITLITALNIINSISMSVSARMKQYGVMRAIGMEDRQLTKMIAAEAFAYALSGCVLGCIFGLPLSKLLYDYLIAAHFSYAAWSLPMMQLFIILLFVLGSAVAAVYASSKRMRNISATEIINEL